MAAKQIKFKSIGEAIYYFFRKKTFPICGSTLIKIKREEKKGFKCWRTGLLSWEFGNLSIITINYYCPKCKNMKSLSEIYEMHNRED